MLPWPEVLIIKFSVIKEKGYIDGKTFMVATYTLENNPNKSSRFIVISNAYF